MIENILPLTEKLISIPSVTGEERLILEELESVFTSNSWKFERLPFQPNRWNLLVRFGAPEILFTTHIDVVPASEGMFKPRWDGEKLIGRGACDAKGIAATMIAVCKELSQRGETNFGLLLVVDEEMGGAGARSAAEQLKNQGVRFLINGEPTEGKLYKAHKGALALSLTFTGKACHSGYPELGDDANKKMIEVAHTLLNTDFGVDEVLGKSTINLAMVSGGLSLGTISPSATLKISIRTVTDNAQVLEKVKSLSQGATIQTIYDSPTIKLHTVPGLETAIGSYSTDVPNFRALNATPLLYGPGSIHVAHTEHEFITKSQIQTAFTDYLTIFDSLKHQTIRD